MKKILLILISILLICGGAYLYVFLKMHKATKPTEEYAVTSKLPIEPYLFQEPPKEEAKNVIENLNKNSDLEQKIVQSPSKENPTDSKSKQILKEGNTKEENQDKDLKEKEEKNKDHSEKNLQQYTRAIFEDNNKSDASPKTSQIQIQRVTSSIKILHENTEKRKYIIDYGANEIKGESRINASNENKLYRTFATTDKIPVIITQKLISTLGGSIVGQVRDNVYAYMGNAVLIPKGSKIEGEYLSNNKAGEDKIQIVWTRILTPQGVNIRLIAKTLDIEGASGAKGEIDSHYWERYGFPLTITTGTNLGLIAVSNLTQKVPSGTSQDLLNQGMQDVSNIGKTILQEQVKINPTITIDAGSLVFVSSTKDIFFPIPKDGEVMVQYFNRLEEVFDQSEKGEQK